MLSSVIVDGETVRINPQDVAGAGGEGTVVFVQFRGQTMALKVYHNPTPERGQKLSDFLSYGYVLDPVFSAPCYLAETRKPREVVGFMMGPLPSGFGEIRFLSDKDYRTTNGITTLQVARIFVNGGHAIANAHSQGVVIGDLNDLNSLFLKEDMLFIDVDSFQFGKWGCPVATEEFVDPRLYGFQWATGAFFSPESDWYSFSVLSFKSLLGVHPWKGVHPKYAKIPSRAKNKAFVLGPDVIYPQLANPPDLLSDDLLQVFWRIFANGERFVFPLDELESYLASLVECSTCHSWYPSSRTQCPICKAVTIVAVPVKRTPAPIVVPSGQGVTMTELIRTEGPILLTRVIGKTVYVIAREGGAAVLYTKEPQARAERRPLVKDSPGMVYGIMTDDSDRPTLVIGNKEDTKLTVIDIAGPKLRGLLQTTTAWSQPKRGPIFAVADNHLFRVAGSELVAGAFNGGGQLVERHVRNVTNNQTWYEVNPSAEKPMVFGFFQVFRDRMYWFGLNGEMYDLAVAQLDNDEADSEWSVQFSSKGALLQRVTQQKGIEYLRTEQVDAKGQVIYSRKIKRDDHPYPTITGTVYSTGVIYHATDDGLVRETLLSTSDANFSVLSGSEVVKEGDKLFKFGRNLLIVQTDAVYEATFN